MIKKIGLLLLLSIGTLLAAGTFLIYANNRSVVPPSEEELKTSLEESIQWLLKNRDYILTQQNSILWWMLEESGKLTNDPRLQKLTADYVKTLHVFSPWQHFFNPNSLAPVRQEQLEALPDYNIHFLYGLTCNQDLGELAIVQQQNQPDFCRETHPISPACLTHQLMGSRFMQRRDYGNQKETSALIATIQDKIENQLTWDPRVVDVYIQRVLMLVDSGVAERVKPIWLRKVLEAQLSDGGWGGFQPLIPLGGSRYWGFSQKLAGVGRPKSNLHATAQGVWLLSILTQNNKPAGQPTQQAL